MLPGQAAATHKSHLPPHQHPAQAQVPIPTSASPPSHHVLQRLAPPPNQTFQTLSLSGWDFQTQKLTTSLSNHSPHRQKGGILRASHPPIIQAHNWVLTWTGTDHQRPGAHLLQVSLLPVRVRYVRQPRMFSLSQRSKPFIRCLCLLLQAPTTCLGSIRPQIARPWPTDSKLRYKGA